WDVLATNLLQGTNNLYVRVADRANNVVTTNMLFKIKYDNVSPDIDAAQINVASINAVFIGVDNWDKYLSAITVNFRDNTSLLKEVGYKVVNSANPAGVTSVISTNINAISYNQPFAVTWNLANGGINHVFVIVTDNANNRSEQYLFRIKRDVGSPSIDVTTSVSSEQQGTWYRTSQPWLDNISVTLNDDESGLGSFGYVVISINGRCTYDVNLDLKGVLTPTTQIFSVQFENIFNETRSTINVWAKDTVGMVSTSFLYVFQKDITAPRVSVNGSLTANKYIKWLKDDGAYQNAANFGPNASLSIVIYDPASKVISLSYCVQVGNAGSISWNSISLAGSVLTYNQGVSIPWLNLKEGSNKIWINAIDMAGNTLSELTACTINKDTISPSCNASSHYLFYLNTHPWINSSNQLPAPFINISFSDSGGSGLKSAKYKLILNGVTQNISYNIFTPTLPTATVTNTTNTGWRIDWSVLTDGVNEMLLIMEDHAGNIITSDRVVYVNRDSIAPTASTIGFPSQNIWYNVSQNWIENVNISFRDMGGAKLQSVWHTISNDRTNQEIPIALNIDSTNYNTPWKVEFYYPQGDYLPLQNGINYISYKVIDNATNSTNYSNVFKVKKDVMRPSFNNLELNDFTRWYNASQNWMSSINVDFFDQHSGLATISFIVSNSMGAIEYRITKCVTKQVYAYTNNWKISWDSVLTNGLNEVFASFSDYAKNTQNSGLLFTIKKDIVPPWIINNQESDFVSWYRTTPDWFNAINISFYDAGSSDIKEVSYNIIHRDSSVSSRVIVNGTPGSTYVTPWTLYWADLQEGINTVQVAVIDYADNYVSTAAFVVKKDSFAPTMNDILPITTTSKNIWYASTPNWATNLNIDFGDNRSGDSGMKLVSYIVTNNGYYYKNSFYNNSASTTKNFVNNWAILWGDLREGTNNISLEAVDSATNNFTTNNYLKIKKDISDPYLIISDNYQAIFSGWFKADNPPIEFLNHISINFIDTYSGLKSATYIISNNYSIKNTTVILSSNIGGAALYQQPWSISWNTLSNGANEVYVVLVDSVDHIVTYKPFSVMKDTEMPTITENITKSSFTSWLNMNKPGLFNAIAVTVNDLGGSGIDKVEWKVSVNRRYISTQEQAGGGLNSKLFILNLYDNWSLVTD
ncbi:MAG: hypothetical protein WCH76_06290, partial [Candidatus Riflemargulisbacteria bacterium]